MRLTNKTCIDTAYLRALAGRIFDLIRETEDHEIVDNIRKWTTIRVEYSPRFVWHGKAFIFNFKIKIFIPNCIGEWAHPIWLLNSPESLATIAYTLHHEIMHLLGYQHGDRFRNGDRMGSIWRAFHVEKWIGIGKEIKNAK